MESLFSNIWFTSQTKRKSGYGEEAGRIAFNILNRNSASPFPKKTGKEKDEKKEKEVKKGVSYQNKVCGYGYRTTSVSASVLICRKFIFTNNRCYPFVRNIDVSKYFSYDSINFIVDSSSWQKLSISLLLMKASINLTSENSK